MSRKPTMNDVAKLAEVGRGTVSNYINGQKVKEENRLKIQKAIDELGYVPNLQAKELRTSINTEVVFIVPTNWTPFFSEMIFKNHFRKEWRPISWNNKYNLSIYRCS